MKKNVYHPVRYFLLTFIFTWVFYVTAIIFNSEDVSIMIMIFGMFAPATVSTVMIFKSKDKKLIKDFKEKSLNFKNCNPVSIGIVVLLTLIAVAVSILLSPFFGQSLSQFSFSEEFSFDGISILLSVLILFFASLFEEFGWHSYGFDSIAQKCTWFKAACIFSVIWSTWHIPLFWIPGTYQCGLREANIGFMINFLISIIPLAFIITWVYLKNNRNIFVCVFIHMFINLIQEMIAMTAVTKCVETFVLIVFAVILILCDKKMFFDKEHIDNLP